MKPILQPGITVPTMTFLAANLGKSVAIEQGKVNILRHIKAMPWTTCLALPSPAIVLRAMRGLGNVPKPAPITGDDWCLGPRDAAVSIIEYGDYQCSHCARVYQLLERVLPL